MSDAKTDFIRWLQKERNDQFTQLFSEDVLINLKQEQEISRLQKISLNNYQNLTHCGSNIQFHKIIKSNIQEINQTNKFQQTKENDLIGIPIFQSYDTIYLETNLLDQNERIDPLNYQQPQIYKQPKQEFVKEEIPLRKLIAILK
ncbi:unnamed protein product [Paramecium octaurelia]|uniref:Uncharacterized protein n=1 Tax=Paramecium octaurelia TaxID=43137 RepID=A0A8S1TVE3_PAROT|nr:unnamed protein product [Paramecium octaurelia]